MDSSWSLYQIWMMMSVITKITLLVMALMLLCTVYNLALHLVRQRTAHLNARSILRLLEQRASLGEIIVALGRRRDLSSPLVFAGLQAFQSATSSFSNTEAIQVADLAMQRCERNSHLEAQRSLIPLDTVANIAPLMGMFSTVFRILNASRGPGVRGMAGGFAFSVIPIIVGLVAAVLAALVCGYASRGIEELDAHNIKLTQSVVAYLNTQTREQPTSVGEDSPSFATGGVKARHHGTRLLLTAL